jgi:hypothetical protein
VLEQPTGAFISPPHLEPDLCLLIFLIPDAFVREVIRELAAELRPLAQPSASDDTVIRLNNDTALSAFFHSMLVYFAGEEPPAEALLKLKLKELLASLLISLSNPTFVRLFSFSGDVRCPALACDHGSQLLP